MSDFRKAADPAVPAEPKSTAPRASSMSDIQQERSGTGTMLAVVTLALAAIIGGFYMYNHSDSVRKEDTSLVRDPVTVKPLIPPTSPSTPDASAPANPAR